MTFRRLLAFIVLFCRTIVVFPRGGTTPAGHTGLSGCPPQAGDRADAVGTIGGKTDKRPFYAYPVHSTDPYRVWSEMFPRGIHVIPVTTIGGGLPFGYIGAIVAVGILSYIRGMDLLVTFLVGVAVVLTGWLAKACWNRYRGAKHHILQREFEQIRGLNNLVQACTEDIKHRILYIAPRYPTPPPTLEEMRIFVMARDALGRYGWRIVGWPW